MSRELSLATDGEAKVCEAEPKQTASPFSCTKEKRVATAALFCFKERDLNPERVRAKRKQSGGLFSARSGEPETVACDGRRAMSMQGGAAADGKSLLLHQRKKSRKGGSFCFKERDLNPERVRAKRKQSGGLFSARSGEPGTVA